jgi:signal transduction histidine kinase/ActR/RegA family two-component response regulator
VPSSPTRWLPARLSLRSHLLALVAVTLVPVLVFSAVLVVALARHERDTVQRGSRETARALSVAVDQQLDGAIAALSALALSSRLGAGDLRGFYEEAAKLRAAQPGWETIALYDVQGEGVLNVRLPLGERVPPAPDPAAFQRLLATRGPVVSDVRLSRVVQRHVILVGVPVTVRGTLRYVLAASVDFQQRLSVILGRQQFPPEWTATVFDRRKTIVARTRGAEQFVGKPVTPRLAAQSTAVTEGWYEDVTLEGIAVYAAFSRSPVSGWTVAIGVPAMQVDAALRRSLLAVVGAGVAFLVLAGALAMVVGRRIAGSIESLSPGAKALARGAPPPARVPSTVIEVEAVARDLGDAAAVLAERAAERTRIEEERGRLLERAEAARAEAEVANRAKDEFLATVSHELRTPLTAMLGWARMLRSGRLDPEARTRAIEVIERNASQQAQLIEDLLDVSRIITGQLRLDIRPIELVPVLEAALDAVRGAAEAKGLVLETAVAPALGLVRGDPDRLQQVVWNLLSNAIKFTPSGGRVALRAQRNGSEVELSVTDTGTGIERDFLPFVFDRFRQGEPSRGGGGLGLGLALVRHLTELHGGRVAAHSDGPGRGATLTVRLPVAAASEAGRAPAAPRGPAQFPSLTGVRVLVVDDDEDARQLLAIIFQECGAEVVTASSTREALARADDAKPDVVVSDINMPERDGHAFVRELRARGGAAARTPAVALTASARGEDRHRALLAGFDVHVAKPVEPATLAEIVAELAARTRAGHAGSGRV